MNSTKQLPGSMRLTAPQPRRSFIGPMPPWTNKEIIAPVGYSNESIEWVPIDSLVPINTREVTLSTPMRSDTGNGYPAITIGVALADNKVRIHDGHHRYYILKDGNYEGLVPVVRRQNKLRGLPFLR